MHTFWKILFVMGEKLPELRDGLRRGEDLDIAR